MSLPSCLFPVLLVSFCLFSLQPGSTPYCARRVCYVRGYRRALVQRSTDHRGTPRRPGRTATLVPDAGATCAGVAYAVPDEERQRVLQYLDYREKDNYERVTLELFDTATDELLVSDALCYIGKPEACFPDEPSLRKVAHHIARTSGPSGPNAEYALKLQQALVANHLFDPHVAEIAYWLKCGDFGEDDDE